LTLPHELPDEIVIAYLTCRDCFRSWKRLRWGEGETCKQIASKYTL